MKDAAGVIGVGKICLDNDKEWLKGLKTPMDKILKTILDKSVDPKTVKTDLVRMQLVEEEGLAWQSEKSSAANHVGTLLVVLPMKVCRLSLSMA